MSEPAEAREHSADTNYSLSEVEKAHAQALLSLAAIAPGLSEAELRVCLYLVTIQHPRFHTVRASSRAIAEATRLERKNARRAIDSLTRRNLIATRQGGGTLASAYRLNFTQTVCLGGVFSTPPVQQLLPGVGSQQPHMHEPLPEGVGFSRPHQSGPQAPLDIDVTTDSIVDRTLQARPNRFQTSEIAAVRGFAYKWLTLQRGQANAGPPDEIVCAQIATAAGGAGRACDWIRDHQHDYQAENCAYLVSALLQQLHGIAPPTVRRRRAELRVVAKKKAPAAIEPTAEPTSQPDLEFSHDLIRQAIAASKSIR